MNIKNYYIIRLALLLIISSYLHTMVWGQASNRSKSLIAYPNKNYISMDFYNTSTGIYTNNGSTLVLKNWTNDGVVDFSPNSQTGLTQFVGFSGTQIISGSGISHYYNVVFNNPFLPAPFELSKSIQIHGEADFQDGVVEIDGDGLVIFLNDAVVAGLGDHSYVDGKVRKEGQTSFIFPIGGNDGYDKYYHRPASIGPSQDPSNIFEAEYVWNQTDLLYDVESKDPGIELVNDSEYWIIEQIAGSGLVEITLSWQDELITTSPSTLLDDPEKLAVLRWDGSKWISEGGIADLAKNTISVLPSDYGVFTLGRINIDLDGDGVKDEQELADLTDPMDPCSFVLANQSLDPSDFWLNLDCDEDGILNGQEIFDGTDPLEPCSNSYDADQLCAFLSDNPDNLLANLDCDGGGISNLDECDRGSDPLEMSDDPRILPDFNVTYVNTEVEGSVGTNDGYLTDGASYGLVIPVPGNPDSAVPQYDANGNYSFISDVSGEFSFDVEINFPNNERVYSSLKITVLDGHEAYDNPVSNPDIAATMEHSTVTIKTLSNDQGGKSQAALDLTSVSVISGPANGIANVNAVSGDISYTPYPLFSGYDTLYYSVMDDTGLISSSMQIILVNRSTAANTVIASGDFMLTAYDTPSSGNVTYNDYDPNGDLLEAIPQQLSLPDVGEFILEASGDWTFVPEIGFSGPVAIPYSITDNNTEPAKANATLYILVENALGSIGNLVWHDLNGNGIQDLGEEGIAGVNIGLYQDDGVLIDETISGSNGAYQFADIQPGDYYLQFGLVDEFTDFTLANVGMDDLLDSDVDNEIGPGTTGVFHVSAEQQLHSIDAGLYKCSSIGDMVWIDTNHNDLIDEEESGFNNVLVKLYKLVDEKYVLWDETLTGLNPQNHDESGYWNFCTNPGTYYIEINYHSFGLVPVVPNIGYNEQIDSDIDESNGVGTSYSFTLLSGENKLDLGAGFYGMSSIHGWAWEDLDADGVQDADESGVGGELVEVYDSKYKLKGSTYTDEDGYYQFDYLGKDAYFILIDPSHGFGFTSSNVGSDLIDNDIDHNNGYGSSSFYVLKPGEEKVLDIGFLRGVLPLELVSFTGSIQNQYNELEWEVTDQQGVDYFKIERKLNSEDNFREQENIGAQPENKFILKDFDVGVPGLYHYRLSSYDHDGNKRILGHVYLNLEKSEEDMYIYPNPTQSYSKLHLCLTQTERVSVEIYDQLGKRIGSLINNQLLEKGNHVVDMDLSQLASGNYIVKVKKAYDERNLRLNVVK